MKKSIDDILSLLEGLNTIKIVQKKLGIKKSTAIKKISELKKLGYVKTSGGGKQPRIYRISRTKIREIGNPGIIDVINKNSPIQLYASYEHRIFNKKLTIEETIVRAIKSKEFRIVLASLALFNKVKNWHRLYQYAKTENVRRKVGALYDVARTIIKVRKMDNKTRELLLKAKEKDKYIIYGCKSKNYKDIEKKWEVFVPFNKADLTRYKE